MSRLNLHIYPSPILNESRIQRLTRTLSRTGLFDGIEVAGTWRPGLAREEVWPSGVAVRRFGRSTDKSGLGPKIAKTTSFAAGVLRRYRRAPLSVINCHSLSAMPLCRTLARLTGAQLVYDTHELETETVTMSGVRQRIARSVERRSMKSVAHTFVVSDGIRDWYRATYGPIPVDTLYNFPSHMDDTFQLPLGYFYQRFHLPTDATIVIYQGILSHGRGVDATLQAAIRDRGPQSRFEYIFIGFGPMEEAIRIASRENPQIHFHPAVQPEHLLAYTRQADIGLSLHEPESCLSYELAAPNKLLHYLYAGLKVVASDTDEQVGLIERFGRGVTLSELKPQAISRAIREAERLPASPRESMAWEGYDELIMARYLGITEGRLHEAVSGWAGQ